MRTVVARVAGLLAPVLVLGACTSGGRPSPAPTLGSSTSSPSPSGQTLDAPAPAPVPTRDPTAVVDAARDAMQQGASVVVTRTTQDDDDWTHEDIEVSFARPPSARVLHVGDDIWTLEVVEGVGYLKDQSDRKSTNRWTELGDADTTAYLRTLTPAGLLRALDAATSVAAPAQDTVRDVPVTCSAFVLDPATAPALVTDAGPPGEEEAPGVATTDSAAARLCVDSGGRPVEAVVTVGDRVVTSVFSQWGLALEAMPPPDGLLDGQDG